MIKDSTQFNDTLKNNKKVVAIFSHPDCGPCQTYKMILPKVEANHPDVIFIYVNIEKVPKPADKHKVHTVPTTVIFLSGEKKDSKMGAMSAQKLSKYISRKLG